MNCLLKMNKPIFVFDCNALISAHLIPKSISRKAFEKAMQAGILVRSPTTFLEFSTRFARSKFDKYLSLENRLAIVSAFKQQSLLIEPTVNIKAVDDPDDDKYLELAIASNAACIVSGDKHLLNLHPFENIPILSTADFFDKF